MKKNFLNISKKGNIVIHALAYMGMKGTGNFVSVSEIAEYIEAPKPYLSKILQECVKLGLIISSKGSKGGFTIKKETININLYDLISMIDGEFPNKYCLLNIPDCCDKKDCPLKKLNYKIMNEIKKTLSRIKIKDIIKNFKEAL